MDALVSDLRSLTTDGLRALAQYSPTDYSLHYVRDDVATQYTKSDLNDIYDDLVLQGIDTHYLESLFSVGSLNCTIHEFDDAVLVHFPQQNHTGLFASFDPCDGETLMNVVASCNDALAT